MVRLQSIHVVEGEPFQVDYKYRGGLRQSLQRLHLEMGLRLFPLREEQDGFKIWNLIGTIDIGGLIIEVAPKTKPGQGWISSVLALRLADDRISIAGELPSDLSEQVSTILDALAAIYARRLLGAIRRDGPIALIQRQHVDEPGLRGKLMVSQLVHRWFVRPGYIPQEVNRLSCDNDYSRALAFVATFLGKQVRSQRTRARLSEAVGLLIPGTQKPLVLPPGIAGRALPQQFAAYRPAWSIAIAVLAGRSLLGPIGEHVGVSLAIEPWPLLERLLERALEACCAEAFRDGLVLDVPFKERRRLLIPSTGAPNGPRELIPDGLLSERGSIIASFEAKYRDYEPQEGPTREEVYQAIAAARATSSPLAVLVYPVAHDAAVWQVISMGQSPRYLATIGLDLFGYHQHQETELGDRLYQLLATIRTNAQHQGSDATL